VSAIHRFIIASYLLDQSDHHDHEYFAARSPRLLSATETPLNVPRTSTPASELQLVPFHKSNMPSGFRDLALTRMIMSADKIQACADNADRIARKWGIANVVQQPE
jgi:hypothetical protein